MLNNTLSKIDNDQQAFPDWESLSPVFNASVASSSTSLRVLVLNLFTNLVHASKIPTSETKAASLRILKTYDYYSDVNSRNAVVAALDALVRSEPSTFLTLFAKFVSSRIDGASLAIADYMTMITWLNAFLVLAAELNQGQDVAALLVKMQMTLLTQCLLASDGNGRGTLHINRLCKSAIRSTRTALVDALTRCSDDTELINTWVKTFVCAGSLVNDTLVFLGQLTIALIDVSPVRPGAANSFPINDVIEWYAAQVLLAKIAPAIPALDVFGNFVRNHISLVEFDSILMPNVEKSIMRSSEVAFGAVLPSLFAHLDSSMILDKSLSNTKLLTSILSAFKSSKEPVRDGAYTCLVSILLNNFAGASFDASTKVIDEVLKAIKASPNAEWKASLAKALNFLPTAQPAVSENLLNLMLPILSKDQNEISLGPLIAAFVSRVFEMLVNENLLVSELILAKYSSQIVAGISDKKPSLLRIWATQICELLMTKDGKLGLRLAALLNEIFPFLLKSLEQSQLQPLLAITNKTVTSAYATIALAKRFKHQLQPFDESSVFSASLSAAEKPPLLTSPKVYTKLIAEEDLKWAIRALSSSLEYVSDGDKQLYGASWLYFLISSKVPHQLRFDALRAVKNLITSDSLVISEILVAAIENAILENDQICSENDLLGYSFNNMLPVLSAVTQVEKRAVAAKNLCSLLVVANHELVHLKNGWVGLVQASGHAIEVGGLVAENSKHLLLTAYALALNNNSSGMVHAAAVKAICVLAFIDPTVVTPDLVERISQDVNVAAISEIDATDLCIFQAKDGELVVNVLEQDKPRRVEDKNIKDYEIRKWEESIKKELSSKAANKKLSKDELKLVSDQLEKESSVRASIQTTVDRANRALSVIHQLTNEAIQVDNGSSLWYPAAIKANLSIAESTQSTALFGSRPATVFLNLSKLVSSRLGLMRPFVGVAIFRTRHLPGLPESHMQEPLLNLIGRILFRIKILSDQSPLDALSLSYILPLLINVLETGKAVAIKNSTKQAITSEFLEEDPEEEQLLLSIEIISAHAEAFENDSIPRAPILNVLISLMQLPSKAKLAKECFLTLCRYISINISARDLDLLLKNINTPELFVRTSILEGIDSEFDLTGDIEYSNELWIAAHDTDLNSARMASTIWEESDLRVVPDAPSQLLQFFGNLNSGLRLSIAKSVVAASDILSTSNEAIFESVFSELFALYHTMCHPPEPVLDRFGLPVKSSQNLKDRWEHRSTVALTLKLLAPFDSTMKYIERVFRFLVDEKALGDKEDLVRQELQEAGIEFVKVHGKQNVEILIAIFEASLAAKDQRSKTQDNIKECVIILYGALARHLESSDPRLQAIIDRLIKTLSTPSEDVQYAVSECLGPLVPSMGSRLSDIFDDLFSTLFNGKSFASRRGAAYGIAGLVKGTGIKSLSENDIMRNLTEASDDKKNQNRREGVSFAFECLSQSLGQYFEPFVIEILPIILKSLGDVVPEVREATDAAAKQIMKNTTSFGVKKLIPLAISNLDEIAWRSKKGSVELLGAMAYLDPAQLLASLLTIVPEIVGVLNDTHKEVRKAADQALKRFGEVIRNPEIQSIVPELLNAIGDPTKYTENALDVLIKTQFVHYIDGPSLALIIHVIHRGMRDRSAATKKKACQIVGNMAILVDSKDLSPYLGQLVDELEIAMVDPVPATRSTAARALGSLVEKLGEEYFPTLIPSLLETLQDASKAGDRLGSAQALSEVICGLGILRLEELLPTILSSASSSRQHVRAGFMPLLLFLPVCFGSQFAPYLARIIPPILNGLADTNEDIRDTALRAGRLIVQNYAKKAVDLLLPELELGLLDSSYRIRLSSLELTGDLLFQITGITGKTELEEQSDTSAINALLVEVLGQERRDRVLASLFVCRSDVAGIVRSAAVDIWKALVGHTPRTVKEIVPSLTSLIIRRLASNDEVQRNIAAQTLGEMVRIVGSNALSRLLPVLEEALTTADADSKQGICVALNELIKSSLASGLANYQDTFISIIRSSLVDPAPAVREAAALAFESLQISLGKVVIDEILPYLLSMLESDDSEYALSALYDIMATKSDVIFPILIPTLLSPPIDAFKSRALSSLATVAGPALYRRLGHITNVLIDAIIEAELKQDATVDDIKSAFDNILLSISDDEAVNPLIQQILSLIRHENPVKRATTYKRLSGFFAGTSLDISMYLQDLVTQFIMSLGDPSPQVVEGSFEALLAIVKRQPKETLERLVKPARQALYSTGVSGEELAGFCLPKGPNCVLPIFLHGLMYGNSERRELSALAIADIIGKTPATNLKLFATSLTGPLIRVIGEKVSSDIKAAILTALNGLLTKIPQFLRPFIPQLQRTFVRSLLDAGNDKLRLKAVTALTTLIEYQPRVDSLVTELIAGVKGADDPGVKTAMLNAILAVVEKGGQNLSDVSKTSIMTLVEGEIASVSDKSAISYAKLIGSLSNILSNEEAALIIRTKILEKDDNENDKFSILAVNSFLRYSPAHVFHTGLGPEVIDFIIGCAESDSDYISSNGTLALGKLLLLVNEKKSIVSVENVEIPAFTISNGDIEKLMTQVAKNAVLPNSSSSDCRRMALAVVRTVARFKRSEVVIPNLDVLVPSIFLCIRDPIIPVKLAAEKAYIAVFDLVRDIEMTLFQSWFEGKTVITSVVGTQIVPRSIGDYTKRVASRLAAVERERIEEGGDADTMFSDQIEDLEEIWSVGGY